MSPTTLAIKASTKKSHTTLFRNLVGIAFAAIAFTAGGLSLLVASKYGQFHVSFWVGLLIPVLLGALVFGTYLAAHEATKRLGGFIIGIVTFIGVMLGVVGLIMNHLNKTFLADIFWWGILVAALTGIAIAAVLTFGWLSSKFFVKKTEPESVHEPESDPEK
jgi:hypothetical protein